MRALAGPPDVIRWVSRSGDHGDCAVAAIAMACGVTYEIAFIACYKAGAVKVLTSGVTWGALRRAITSLGFTPVTVPFKKIDFNDGTGILWVCSENPQTKEDHVVYMWRGGIIEPKFDRQEIWEDADQFLKHYHYTVRRLLTVRHK